MAQAGLDQSIIESFIKQRASSNPQQELEKLERLRVQVITIPARRPRPIGAGDEWPITVMVERGGVFPPFATSERRPLYGGAVRPLDDQPIV
ncbi:MAG: hypothetical protein E6I91_06225 [Chloroflexi bacterium]|nr:MAG: hypothetical protein E6I91_06225 [Chloroflexota bacterium]